jgi:ABC-2 type transport system permease protein
VSAAIRAEWTKLRTLTGPGLLLLGAVAGIVALGLLGVRSVTCHQVACGLDAPKTSLLGIQLGQAVVAILGVLVVGTEYSTGLIGPSLTAVPRRLRLLAAKAVVLLGPVLVAGAAAVAAALLLGRHWLPLSLTAGPTLRAGFGSVLYLGLIALFSLGLAAAVRDSATAIGLVLGLLYLFPILVAVVANPSWHKHLAQLGPASAGLAIQATVRLADQPIQPWHGLGVLALWTLGALLLGAVSLRFRDA